MSNISFNNRTAQRVDESIVHLSSTDVFTGYISLNHTLPDGTNVTIEVRTEKTGTAPSIADMFTSANSFNFTLETGV